MLRPRDGQSTLWEELLPPAEARLLSTKLARTPSPPDRVEVDQRTLACSTVVSLERRRFRK
jgi:hypothetical protein